MKLRRLSHSECGVTERIFKTAFYVSLIFHVGPNQLGDNTQKFGLVKIKIQLVTCISETRTNVCKKKKREKELNSSQMAVEQDFKKNFMHAACLVSRNLILTKAFVFRTSILLSLLDVRCLRVEDVWSVPGTYLV
jgi:hypothetical protein